MSRIVAFAGIVIGLFGLGLNFYVVAPSMMTVSELNPVARSLPDMLIYFWSFFTHLSNLGLILVYVAWLTGGRWLNWFRHPVIVGAMAGNIALVMVYYHFMLAPYLALPGLMAWSNFVLHYVTPIIYLGWWLAFAPHGTLRLGDVPAMLAPGLAYLAIILIRGALVGEYPYEILDPRIGGYGAVAMGAGTLVVAVAVFCALMALVDGLITRKRKAG